MGKDKYIPNQIALQQGAGLTEKDELGGLQDVKVKIIQNEECYAKIESAPPRIIQNQFMQELPEGINEGMLCTLGIENEDGVIQVLHMYQIPFKIFSATSASSGSLIE